MVTHLSAVYLAFHCLRRASGITQSQLGSSRETAVPCLPITVFHAPAATQVTTLHLMFHCFEYVSRSFLQILSSICCHWIDLVIIPTFLFHTWQILFKATLIQESRLAMGILLLKQIVLAERQQQQTSDGGQVQASALSAWCKQSPPSECSGPQWQWTGTHSYAASWHLPARTGGLRCTHWLQP